MRLSVRLLLCLLLNSVCLADDAARQDKPILVVDADGHTAIVREVLFTPDGRELITVSEDKTIRLWDVATGEPLRVLRPPIGTGRAGMLYAAALSPDGRTLAVGGSGLAEDGVETSDIDLIDLSSGRIARVLRGNMRVIVSLAFASDGKRLVSGGADQTTRIWTVATGRCELVLKGHTGPVYGVAFSPDGRRLATTSHDGTGRIWLTATGQMEVELKGHTKAVRVAAWSADGQMIATGSDDQTVRLWSLDGQYIRSLERLENEVLSLTFTADSRELLATWGGWTTNSVGAAMLDVATGRERVRFASHSNTVYCGALSPDGALAATSGGDFNEIYIWKTADASPMRRLAGKGRRPWSTGWSSDGKAIAWGNTLRPNSRDNDRGPIERAFRLAELELAPVNDDAFIRARPSRFAIALKRIDGATLRVERNGATAATIKLSPNSNLVRCFTVMPGSRAAVGAEFGLFLFDARTGKIVREFVGHTGIVWAVAPSSDGRSFLSGSGDQTLRIWDPDRVEPLLSIFVAGDDWVAWTPEGYYAASPGGEKLMGWHVNNGRDQMASFFPAAQFREALYRPDVIKLVLPSGGTRRALEVADLARGKATVRTEVAKVLPPAVEIAKPRHGSTVDSPKLEVRAVARSRGGHPIRALRLLLDGRPYDGPSGVKTIERPKLGEIREVWSIALEPGKHSIAVRADSLASHGTSDPVELTYATPEPVQLPALYVLAVGITEYPGDLKLHYAAKDAEAIDHVFREKGGTLYRKVEVKLLTDAKATRNEILNGLTWLRKRMTQRDLGVVYFSCRGHRDSQGSLYLLPVDADPENLLATGVDGDQLKKALEKLPGRVLAFFDASHAMLGGDERKNSVALTDDLVRDLGTDDYGVIAMASSTGREFSLDNNAERQSNFTLAIVEGLSGKADDNQDGSVHLNELDTYVANRVKALTNGAQHPVMAKPASIRSFPLSKP